jgi:hypothetical protein
MAMRDAMPRLTVFSLRPGRRKHVPEANAALIRSTLFVSPGIARAPSRPNREARSKRDLGGGRKVARVEGSGKANSSVPGKLLRVRVRRVESLLTSPSYALLLGRADCID